MAAARVRLFEFYNISNLVYHFLSPLLLPYTPTASPSTFPMLSLVVYAAAGLIDYYHGNKLVLINKSATSRDGQADLVISDSIGKVLGDAVGV